MLGTIIAVVVIVFIIGLAVFAVNGMYQSQIWGYEFNKAVGDNFELADRASDAPTKLMYYEKFMVALNQYGLTHGPTAVFWNKPTSMLENNYAAAVSLENRLKTLTHTDPGSSQYQFGMQQVTTNEFCWFPIDIFEQGWYLQHGVWGSALTPQDVSDRCSSGGSH